MKRLPLPLISKGQPFFKWGGLGQCLSLFLPFSNSSSRIRYFATSQTSSNWLCLTWVPVRTRANWLSPFTTRSLTSSTSRTRFPCCQKFCQFLTYLSRESSHILIAWTSLHRGLYQERGSLLLVVGREFRGSRVKSFGLVWLWEFGGLWRLWSVLLKYGRGNWQFLLCWVCLLLCGGWRIFWSRWCVFVRLGLSYWGSRGLILKYPQSNKSEGYVIWIQLSSCSYSAPSLWLTTHYLHFSITGV